VNVPTQQQSTQIADRAATEARRQMLRLLEERKPWLKGLENWPWLRAEASEPWKDAVEKNPLAQANLRNQR
jgi:hypothetical protein